MRVKILKRSFAGAEFAPDVRALKLSLIHISEPTRP